jgi:RNA polymerase primary sigma factor
VIAAERGDVEARYELVEAFLPAIVAVARSFHSRPGLEQRELVQDGVAGLLFAAQRYDPALGTPFWAYAAFWVRKSMQELAAEMTRPFALSDRAVRDLAQISSARRDHVQLHGTEPSEAQLATATGLSAGQVRSLRAAERVPRAMEEPAGAADQTGATVGDMLADPRAEQAFDGVLDDIEIGVVRSLADRLGERERAVITAHYGLGQPQQTLAQIGGALGCTAERARQIEARALDRLRATLARPAVAEQERT